MTSRIMNSVRKMGQYYSQNYEKCVAGGVGVGATIGYLSGMTISLTDKSIGFPGNLFLTTALTFGGGIAGGLIMTTAPISIPTMGILIGKEVIENYPRRKKEWY
jgi:NhaP-type Na+/H+ or K+/H+ antiporter